MVTSPLERCIVLVLAAIRCTCNVSMQVDISTPSHTLSPSLLLCACLYVLCAICVVRFYCVCMCPIYEPPAPNILIQRTFFVVVSTTFFCFRHSPLCVHCILIYGERTLFVLLSLLVECRVPSSEQQFTFRTK